MRRIVLVLAALALLFALCGCSGGSVGLGGGGVAGEDAAPSQAEVPAEAVAEEEREVPAEAVAEEEREVPAEDDPEAVVEAATEVQPVSLSAEERYRYNLFLTNFTEVFFDDYDSNSAEEEQLLWFAYLHTAINNYSAITYSHDRALISLELVNRTLTRYFGKTVEPAEGQRWGSTAYEDGYFSFEYGIGESYSHMAVVDSVTPTEGSTLEISFKIYIVEEFNTGGNVIDDDSYYNLTPEEAAVSDKVTCVGSARATVKSVAEDGGERLILVEYRHNQTTD